MRKLAKKIAGKFQGLLPDAIGLAGAALISYGCALIYRPVGYIVGGALLLAGVIYFWRARAADPAPRS